MEENEYKSAYDDITQVACVFEKALTNNQCRCAYSKHFWLADREGYACKAQDASAQCAELLACLRENSRFSLKLPSVGKQLPHNMDIRVQVGGLRGLQKIYGDGQTEDKVANIRQLVERAVQDAGDIASLPYSEIVKSVAQYEVRSRRNRREK